MKLEKIGLGWLVIIPIMFMLSWLIVLEIDQRTGQQEIRKRKAEIERCFILSADIMRLSYQEEDGYGLAFNSKIDSLESEIQHILSKFPKRPEKLHNLVKVSNAAHQYLAEAEEVDRYFLYVETNKRRAELLRSLLVIAEK